MLKLTDEDKARLTSQIEDEYAAGLTYVTPKREQYRERILKRGDQSKDPTKISINMIANSTDTLIATSYTDGLTVKFSPRDGWIGQERSDNLNFAADFDNSEDDYQQLYYQKEQDRYFFGVSLRHRYGWDDTRKIPLFDVINPLCWIPDPLPSQSGRFDGKGYRYHGFEMQSTVNDFASDKTYDIEELNKYVRGFFSEETILTNMSYAQAYNYNVSMYPTCVGELKQNIPLGVYHHLTHFNKDGKVIKLHATMSSDRKQFFRIKEFAPVLDEEKKDPSLIEFPIILNYWKPRRNDPFGESVCDKLEDKQTAKTILFNLNLIKAKKEALGGDFIWNSRLLKNKNDILKPTTNGRNIFVDTTESLSNVGYEIPRSQIKADSINMMNAIDNEAKYDVNLDAQQQGILATRDVTATESQIVQANQNIIGLLNNKINSIGDRNFRFHWMRAYVENFASADKKLITINSNFEYKTMALTKDEFLTKQLPFVKCDTKAEIEGQREKDILFWDKSLALIMQDPTATEASKNIAKRMWFRANGKTPNEINVLCPLTQYERKAFAYVSLVNMDIVPESLFSSPPDAFWTYWVYLQKADNTSAKEKVLTALQEALENAPMGGQTNEAFSEMANSTNNIAMSQAIQGSKPPPPSRAALVQ